jgi:hypothetical protein
MDETTELHTVDSSWVAAGLLENGSSHSTNRKELAAVTSGGRQCPAAAASAMRRKIGVSVVKKRQVESEQYNKVGKTLEENKLSFVKDVLSSFKTSLADFSSKHKDRINSDPEFRQQLQHTAYSIQHTAYSIKQILL